MAYSDGLQFGTKDRDNDYRETETPVICAERHRGAWWYGNCAHANLNGPYVKEDSIAAITWFFFKKEYIGLKGSVMMMRPVQNL